VIYIEDNFYNDPDTVRNKLMRLNYNDDAGFNYCEYLHRDHNKELAPAKLNSAVERLTGRHLFRCTSEVRYNTLNRKNSSNIHSDLDYPGHKKLVCMIYLTPDAPLNAGVTLYRHRYRALTGHGETDFPNQADLRDYSQWDEIAVINNVYNRCVVFDSSIYHQPVVNGFGSDINDARLFQVLFYECI